MRVARVLFARLPEQGQVKNRLASELSEAAAFEIYRWLLRVQARAFSTPGTPSVAFTDYVYFAPRAPRLSARYKFSPDLAALKLRFRAQSDGDLGERLCTACSEVLSRHEMVIFWGVDVPCLPAGIFDQAVALYPQSVVTLARAGGCAFLSLAAKNFSPAVFDRIRWNTPAAGADQLRALRNAGVPTIVRGKVTQLEQVKDFTRMLREFEAEQRNADLEDLQRTIEKITER